MLRIQVQKEDQTQTAGGSMNQSTEKTISQALGLPSQIRACLAEKLLESLEAGEAFEISEEWKTEIEKRCADIDEGKVVLKEAEEVFRSAMESNRSDENGQVSSKC
jgi:putative addiction module component (TIGR02574 family)